MYEETSTCPYIGHCGDVQTLQRVEAQLNRERRELFSQSTRVDQGDFNVSFEEYRRRIGHIGRAMNRCRSSYKRCLRFWQLQKMEENEAHIRSLSSVTSEKQESHVYVPVNRGDAVARGYSEGARSEHLAVLACAWTRMAQPRGAPVAGKPCLKICPRESKGAPTAGVYWTGI